MRFNIFYKFIVVVLFIALTVGGIGIYVSSVQEKKLSESFYFKFALSMAKSLNAGVSEQDLFDKEALKPKLFKLLLINPDILAINVYLEENGKLVQFVSTIENNSESIIANQNNYKSFRDNLSLYENETFQGDKVLNVITPLNISGKNIGTYNILVSLDNLYSISDSQFRYFAILFTIITVILFVVISFSVRKIISTPLSKLLDATKEIEKGNFDIHIVNNSHDEITDLSNAYIKMAQQIKLSYTSLEKRVEEATKSERQKRELSESLYLKLKDRSKQAEEQNEILNDNKLAMMNLLEDSKELEDALKVEKDRASAIVSSLGEGLYVVDKEGKIILANQKAQDLFKLDSDQIVGKKWTDVINVYMGDELLPFEKRPVKITIDTGNSVTVGLKDNYYYQVGESKKFPVKITTAPLTDINKITTGAIIVFEDITEDKESRSIIEQEVVARTKELNDEKSKLAASIEALSKAFVMIDLSGNVILTNENINTVFDEKKTNWTFNDIQEKLGTSFDFKKAYEKVIKDEQRIEYDDIELGAKWLQVRLSPVFSEVNGKKTVSGTLAIIGDVTDEKVLERSKDEFFSIASHELRTPLTAIRGNTSMILDYYKDAIKDPELKLMITDMHDASLRLIGIVNDFLDLSRLEQGRMEYKISDVKLSDVITNVVKELKATADEKKIKLLEDIQGDVTVNIDPDKLKEVLFNIIGNSIKFTDEGSVTINSELKDDKVLVRIIDTGKGIPLANQSLLFRKFQQAGSSTITRDGAKGTGLGLYISKLMIEGMGGTIALESSVEGKGSVFVFALPLAKS